ncbi:hypothetical protein Pcinc_006826 [Petrolisthes cinctipes]|uniref:Uncharacterized protein n=1 Tax=Petrolisthes cinctipes TaxID=88211 RepID=A0AAE1GAT4_PETCI|nr:hypothetical protein Pcinc_006826 [Petrolisthes cinctipes]
MDTEMKGVEIHQAAPQTLERIWKGVNRMKRYVCEREYFHVLLTVPNSTLPNLPGPSVMTWCPLSHLSVAAGVPIPQHLRVISSPLTTFTVGGASDAEENISHTSKLENINNSFEHIVVN